MDSKACAEAIEKAHPSPSLHLDSHMLKQVTEAMTSDTGMFRALFPTMIHRVPGELLNPRSQEYFDRTRCERLGVKNLEEFHEQKGGESAWEAARPALAHMAALLNENKEGPYFMGKTPSYADFALVGMLQFYKRAGGETFERVCSADPAFKAVYDGCEQWLQRAEY